MYSCNSFREPYLVFPMSALNLSRPETVGDFRSSTQIILYFSKSSIFGTQQGFQTKKRMKLETTANLYSRTCSKHGKSTGWRLL